MKRNINVALETFEFINISLPTYYYSLTFGILITAALFDKSKSSFGEWEIYRLYGTGQDAQ